MASRGEQETHSLVCVICASVGSLFVYIPISSTPPHDWSKDSTLIIFSLILKYIVSQIPMCNQGKDGLLKCQCFHQSTMYTPLILSELRGAWVSPGWHWVTGVGTEWTGHQSTTDQTHMPWGLNPETSYCDTTVPTTAPLCHVVKERYHIYSNVSVSLFSLFTVNETEIFYYESEIWVRGGVTSNQHWSGVNWIERIKHFYKFYKDKMRLEPKDLRATFVYYKKQSEFQHMW